MNRGADVHVGTPLRSRRVIAPVFVNGGNFSGFYFYKGSDMVRDVTLARIDMYRCDNEVSKRFNAFDFSVPAARGFAVGADKFITGEAFICVVPIDIGIFVKKAFISSAFCESAAFQ